MDGKAFFRRCVPVFVLLGCLAVISAGCKDDDDPPWYQGPPLYVEPFEDVTDAAGFTGVTATFVAWGDYDNDGREDLILDGRRLFHNNVDGTFTEATAAGIDPNAGGAGAAWADIDNDGDLDLFCSGYKDTTGDSLDRLYLNNLLPLPGDETFTDITTPVVSDDLDSRTCAWGDFDGDGDIDLYVVNYEEPPGSGIGVHDRLYMNNGDNTFTDTSVSSGIAAATPRVGRAVACCDYDLDHDLDIFVANDSLDPNFFWVNNGSGVFTNEAAALSVGGTDEGGGYFGSSTGVSWGDYDGDLDFDLLVTNQKSAAPQPYEDDSHFFVNLGVDNFGDSYHLSWIAADAGARCPAWLDYNNDTQQDFYLCSETGQGQLYNGHGTGAFINVAGSAALGVQKPLGCAFADYDNDGGLDIFICAADRVYLFKNTHDRYNWLRVKLTGSTSNSAGIGSTVRVTCPCTTPETFTRQIGGGNGTGCQDSLIAHFGMGLHDGDNHDGFYTVDIIWSGTSGTTIQQVTGVAMNQLHIIPQP